MVHGMLPAGRSVKYAAEEGEEIPTQPVGEVARRGFGHHGDHGCDCRRRHVPKKDAASCWCPMRKRRAASICRSGWRLTQNDHLLVNSAEDAEAHVASMQRFMEVLHLGRGFAPYIVADEQYQQKRYGMLGQLVNQGRALARYETREIINTIKERAAQHDLNRGLSLSVPYFDDQELAHGAGIV